ncbi:hypothetical protein OG21DRAFT_1507760, partial [Imleria badia]
MPWSEAVVEQFSLVDRSTSKESDWRGPFITLLFELFPISEHFQIVPELKRIKGSKDVFLLCTIRKRCVPIFFVEINGSYCSLVDVSVRALADDQMRDCFRELMSDSISMPKLIGISAFGTQCCIYTLNTKTRFIEPA